MPAHRLRACTSVSTGLTAALLVVATITGCGENGGNTSAGPVKGKQMSNVGPAKDTGTGGTGGTGGIATNTGETPLPPGARDGMKAIDTSKFPITPDPARPDAQAKPDSPTKPSTTPAPTKDAKASSPATTVNTDPPIDPTKPLSDDEKKKRDEAREKALAKAGVDTKQPYTGATPTPGTTPAPTDPKTSDPTKTIAANPTKEPIKIGPPGPVDPNTPSPGPLPEHLKADREAIKKFEASKLKVVNGYTEVPYSALAGYAFPTVIAAEDGKDKDDRKIPDEVKKLNGKEVVIQGYMMPIDFEDGGTNEFVLTRIIPSCFYCQPPQLNDWIEVKIKDAKRVPYVPDGPILVYGKIEVGEKFEDGFVVSLYRLTGVKVEKAPNP